MLSHVKKFIKLWATLITTLGGLALLTACSPVSVVTGTSATIGSLALSDGGFDVSLSDTQMNVKISKSLSQTNYKYFTNVDVEVHEARVLLTGHVGSDLQRLKASQIAWATPAVQEVINEIKVMSPIPVAQIARDSVNSLKIMTSLTFDKNVYAVNYKVSVFNKHVYVIGVAQSKEEENAIIGHIRNTEGIEGYTSEILLTDDPRRFENLKALMEYIKAEKEAKNQQKSKKSDQNSGATPQQNTQSQSGPIIKKVTIANPK